MGRNLLNWETNLRSDRNRKKDLKIKHSNLENNWRTTAFHDKHEFPKFIPSRYLKTRYLKRNLEVPK